MVVIVGISFNLIIIRVDKASSLSMPSTASVGGTSFPLRFVRSEGAGDVTQRNVEIMISRDVSFNVSASETDKEEGAASVHKKDVDPWNAI